MISVWPERSPTGKIAIPRISSPLQGRVLEVRAHLGERVQAGSVLLVLDSQEIAQAYSEYVKEDSDLQYATRARELAKDLYENKALALKDLKQAENELIKARAEFRRAKERLLSLRVPAQELDKPLEQQKITSRFEMKSPLSRDCRGTECDARPVDRGRLRPGVVHGGRPRYAAGGGGCL